MAKQKKVTTDLPDELKRKTFVDERGRIITPTVRREDGRPVSVPLPNVNEINNMSNAQLRSLLERFGVAQAWPELHGQVSAYVARMSNIPPGTPGFEAEVKRLTEGDDKRFLRQLARRTQETWTTARAADGNENQEFIRILDDHEHQCGPCIERAGAIGTYAEHVAIGLPGPASCDGGGWCRCELYPID